MKFLHNREALPITITSSHIKSQWLKLDYNNSDFLPSIVHELKTPLSAIIGFSEALKQEISDPKSVLECIDYINEVIAAASEMNELIHDLLDVEQALSGNFSVDMSDKIEVRNVIKRSVKLNRDYALRRQICLGIEISDEVDVINLDVKRMKQVLTNLISNAVKYSKAGTEIKILAKKINNILEISVIDQGFGMTKEQVETAFLKYRTIANENSHKVDSFGLGLPIVKQLVELQNGKIEVSSEVGIGTEVKLKFPYLM